MPILDELKKKANGKADSANNIAEAIAQMDFSGGGGGSVTPEEIAEAVSAYLDEHLANPTNPPIDTSLSIAGAAADAKKTGDELTQLKSDLTDVNAELADVRVGANGVTYGSAGAAVRGQITDINDGLNNTVLDVEQSPNIFNGLFPQVGGISPSTGEDLAVSGYKRTDYIQFDNSNLKLYILRTSQPYLLNIYFYDSSRSYISKTDLFSASIDTFNASVSIPANASYFRFMITDTWAGNVQVSYNNEPSFYPYGDYLYGVKDAFVTQKQLAADVVKRFENVENIIINNENVKIDYHYGRYIQNGYDNAYTSYINSINLIDAGIYNISNIGTGYQFGIWEYISDSSANTIIAFTNTGFDRVNIPNNSKICVRKLDGTTITENEIESIKTNFTIKKTNNITKSQKVVFLGDSIFGLERGNTSIPSYCEFYTGAKCYNCAMGGTEGNSHGDATWSNYDFSGLSQAIATNDYTAQRSHLSDSGVPDYFVNVIDQLASIDFSTIDLICLTYGGNDYAMSHSDVDTFVSAMCTNINRILDAYPNIRIILMNPPYKMFLDSTTHEYVDDGDTHQNTFGKTLQDYAESYETISKNVHMPYIDAYNELGINRYNATQWFNINDGSHPNKTGRKETAKLIAEYLKRMIID